MLPPFGTMDFKGIDFRTFNILPAQLLTEADKEKPPVRPVKKGQRTTLRSRKRRREVQEYIEGRPETSEEEAAYALEVMKDFLDENPGLEAVLAEDEEPPGTILVRDRKTKGKVATVLVSDVISGTVFDRDRGFGSLLDKRV